MMLQFFKCDTNHFHLVPSELTTHHNVASIPALAYHAAVHVYKIYNHMPVTCTVLTAGYRRRELYMLEKDF